MSEFPAEDFVCERADIFSKLEDFAWFQDFIVEQVELTFSATDLIPSVSLAAIQDSFAFFHKDVFRVSKIEYDGKSLDHFKRCGHLTYWLRRTRPIADIGAKKQKSEIASSSKIAKLQKLLLGHSNEYLAFDIGFRICRFFEAKRSDARAMLLLLNQRPSSNHQKDLIDAAASRNLISSLSIDEDYIYNICHVLKEKNVSPHAIHMIYKSLFFNLRG